MRIAARFVTVALVMLVSRSAEGQLSSGMKLCVDTIEVPSAARGSVIPFAGRITVADHHGRIDITAVRRGPATLVNGALVSAPAWRPSDYYLFSDSALLLVQPRTRTYARLPLSEVVSNRSPALLAGDVLTSFVGLRFDTVRARHAAGIRRLPYTIQMHVDVRQDAEHTTSLARARVAVQDAPVGEASVVRWVGAARILEEIGPSVRLKAGESLQLTAAVILEPGAEGAARALIGTGMPITCIQLEKISRSRLALPRGYDRIPWPSVVADR